MKPLRHTSNGEICLRLDWTLQLCNITRNLDHPHREKLQLDGNVNIDVISSVELAKAVYYEYAISTLVLPLIWFPTSYQLVIKY